MIKPASHSKANFTDTQSISLIGNTLARHGRVMPNLTTIDKWPNIDGRVEVQNESRDMVGPLSVQAKTLPADHKLKFRCPVTFLSYCELEPCLLLGVDNENEKIYWLYFDATIIKDISFQNNKQSKTLYFDPGKYFDRTNTEYVEEWIRIIENNKQRIRGYDNLRIAYDSILQNTNETVGTNAAKFTKMHLFLDETNKLLDVDFPTIKKFFYPNTWKLGLAYEEYKPQSIIYALYPIPLDKNDVQIKEINQTLAERIKREGLGFTGHFAENPIEDRPKAYAKEIIGSKVMKLTEKKLLSHTGHEILAREFVIAFIDKFNEQMGLREKDEYHASEVLFGFYDYLPIWMEEAYNLMLREDRNNIRERLMRKGYYDPDILWQLSPSEREEIISKVGIRLGTGSQPMRMANEKLDIGVFLEFLNYLKNNDVIISRVYKKHDFSRFQGKGGVIWNAYSKGDTEHNIHIVIKNLEGAYNTITANNFPSLARELNLFGDANKIAFNFELKDEYGGIKGPGYKMFYIKDKRISSDKILCVIDDKEASILRESFWSNVRTHRNIKNDELQIIREIDSVLDFIYDETPLLSFTYELIENRLKKHFGS